MQSWFRRRSSALNLGQGTDRPRYGTIGRQHLARAIVSVDEYEDAGKSRAEIIEERSPEGCAVMLRLNQAEQACMEAQRRATRAIQGRQDFTAEFAAFEEAFAEVDRMRKEVYRMVRQWRARPGGHLLRGLEMR